jgi:2-polyprenyl-3-methyl-5-hydroxy-6-metoxy-1,4-benzoquinol methylase
MPKVSIIIPVIRPANIPSLKKMIKSNAGIPRSDYEFIIEEDVSRIGTPKMVKKLTSQASSDLVMFLGDDCEPCPGFLARALETMAQFPDGWGLVGLYDIERPGNHAPAHWLAHKKLLEVTGGEFFHTGYIHQYCDNELCMWADGIGRYRLNKMAKVNHRHAGFKDKTRTFKENLATSTDADMKRVYSNDVHAHDAALFKSRESMITRETLEYVNKSKTGLRFTGERVVIGDMKNYIPTLQEHLARYVFALGPAINKRVIDLACGTGYGTNLLKEAAMYVAGADIDHEAIVYANKLYPTIPFSIINLDKGWPWPTEEYDLCVSFETIEHLSYPDIFLKNVADHCDEFLFSIPVNNPSKYHKQVWTKEQIVDIMSKYWPNITWFHQTGFSIFQGLNNATFIIGYATK